MGDDRLGEIQERRFQVLAGWSVPEPDRAKHAQHRYCEVVLTNDFGIEVVPFTNGDVTTAEFIAHAASDIDYLLERRIQEGLAGYAAGFQAGADAARRECAGIAEAKGAEYEKLGDYGINQDYVRKVEAANDIAAAISQRVGQVVKEQQ